MKIGKKIPLNPPLIKGETERRQRDLLNKKFMPKLYKAYLKNNSRILRKNMTKAEVILWNYLRKKQFPRKDLIIFNTQ